MRIVLCIFLTLIANVGALEAQKPEKENLTVKVLKVERIRDERDSNLWYVIKLTFRDSNGRLYHVRSECVTNLGVDLSCANLVVPRAGATYTVLNYGDFIIEFGTDKVTEKITDQTTHKITYEVESVEVFDCK